MMRTMWSLAIHHEDQGEGSLISKTKFSNFADVHATNGERGEPLRSAALNWNLPFAPPDYKHGRMSYRPGMVNPVLVPPALRLNCKPSVAVSIGLPDRLSFLTLAHAMVLDDRG
jgi:hypothetical protein